MKTTILTNEYPPNVYGGAGVHVDYLSRNLKDMCEVEVRCFGDNVPDNDGVIVKSFNYNNKEMTGGLKVLETMKLNIDMIKDIKSDIVHAHTWYTFFGGLITKKYHKVPLITTIHSLEPLRPWKSEQLGEGGYGTSGWIEAGAILDSDRVIAVSASMRDDILKYIDVPSEKVVVINNGIDTDEFKKVNEKDVLIKHGIDGKYVLFVGRMTKQKGIEHLIEASEEIKAKIVIVAGAADTPELEKYIIDKSKRSDNIILIREMLDKKSLIQLYSNAEVFVCPSVYEPFGIINLEAMACETPVVATKVGGIVEVVKDGSNGLLIEPESKESIVKAVNTLLESSDMKKAFGMCGRRMAVNEFSWKSIAQKTYSLYDEVLNS